MSSCDLSFALFGSVGPPRPPGGCRTWFLQPSPNAPGMQDNWLNSMAYLAADDIWAVGRSYGHCAIGDFNQNTLAMHYDGSTWTIVPTPNPTAAPELIELSFRLGQFSRAGHSRDQRSCRSFSEQSSGIERPRVACDRPSSNRTTPSHLDRRQTARCRSRIVPLANDLCGRRVRSAIALSREHSCATDVWGSAEPSCLSLPVRCARRPRRATRDPPLRRPHALRANASSHPMTPAPPHGSPPSVRRRARTETLSRSPPSTTARAMEPRSTSADDSATRAESPSRTSGVERRCVELGWHRRQRGQRCDRLRACQCEPDTDVAAAPRCGRRLHDRRRHACQEHRAMGRIYVVAVRSGNERVGDGARDPR